LFSFCVPCGNATPSIMYSGLLEVLMELKPRILTLVCPPGRPEFVFTCTPGTRPAIAWFKDEGGRSCSCDARTEPTAPVRSDFLLEPQPTTTTSSIDRAPGSRLTFIVVELPRGTSRSL